MLRQWGAPTIASMIPCRKCRPGTMGRPGHCSRSSAKHQKPRQTPRRTPWLPCRRVHRRWWWFHMQAYCQPQHDPAGRERWRQSPQGRCRAGGRHRRCAAGSAHADCSEVTAWAAVLADPRIEGSLASVQRYPRRPHHADAELLAVSRAHPGRGRPGCRCQGLTCQLSRWSECADRQTSACQADAVKIRRRLIQISPGGPSSAGSSC